MDIGKVTQMLQGVPHELFVDPYEHCKKVNIIFRNSNPTQKELDTYKRSLKVIAGDELISLEQKMSKSPSGNYKRIVVTIKKQ